MRHGSGRMTAPASALRVAVALDAVVVRARPVAAVPLLGGTVSALLPRLPALPARLEVRLRPSARTSSEQRVHQRRIALLALA